ncbi:MAG: hypothetical protein U0232_13815 [Thermomicrobiales bacterium]
MTFAQTISFITRAMIAKGYWVAKPHCHIGVPDGHAIDFRTFHFYTGGVPLAESWNGSASRDWFAQALWAALNSYGALTAFCPMVAPPVATCRSTHRAARRELPEPTALPLGMVRWVRLSSSPVVHLPV